MASRNPTVFIYSEETSAVQILRIVFEKLGIAVETFLSPDDFLARLHPMRLELALIDLRLDSEKDFDFIIAARKVLGPKHPLFILGETTDKTIIRRTLTAGASDFIIKPLERILIETKFSRYLNSDSILEIKKTLVPETDGMIPATLLVPFEVQMVDEFGLKLLSRHLVTKGVAMYLDSQSIREITGKNQPVLVNFTSTWVESSATGESLYGGYAEFDSTDSKLMANVRSWLSGRKIVSEELA